MTKRILNVRKHPIKSGGTLKYRVLFVFMAFLSISTQGQINAEIDTAHIKIGEPVNYTLKVPFQKNDRVILTEFRDTLSAHIEILEQKTDTLSVADKRQIIKEMTLTGYEPGNFLIRSLPVVVNNDTLLSPSFQLEIDDVEIDSANLEGFAIKPIMSEEWSWKDYLLAYWKYLAGLGLAVLALIIFLMYRRKKKILRNRIIIKTPYEEAIDSLKALDQKKYVEKGAVYSYYSELSFILRRFLGRNLNFPSLEMLSDDLVDFLRKTVYYSKEDLKELKEFLMDSDLVKYAKAVPEENKNKLYRNWVEALIEKSRAKEDEEETTKDKNK